MVRRSRSPRQVVRHLPVHLTNFVGRAEAVSDLTTLVSRQRLVTVCGAGGVGKPRLAIEVAAATATHLPDGICYLDLEPISDPAIVSTTLPRATPSARSAVQSFWRTARKMKWCQRARPGKSTPIDMMNERSCY